MLKILQPYLPQNEMLQYSFLLFNLYLRYILYTILYNIPYTVYIIVNTPHVWTVKNSK